MYVIDHLPKFWEFLVGLKPVELPSPLPLPGIVDVDVGPAVVTQAHFYHGIG